jgi:glutathione S-transferase
MSITAVRTARAYRSELRSRMRYELYYWPIQGRGEFARLILEDAGADWVDVCRARGGMAKMQAIIDGARAELLPFAPPFLHVDDCWLAQSAQIASFLGERLGLAPQSESQRLVARTIMLTIADLLNEVHDTHHPISVEKTYEKQREAAAERAGAFRATRLAKFTDYLELNLERTGTGVLVGNDVTYVDLAAFQIVEGLRYAFPRAFAAHAPKLPRLIALHDNVAMRPRIAAYLQSSRRIPFDETGIFRHYPALDTPTPTRKKVKARAASRR